MSSCSDANDAPDAASGSTQEQTPTDQPPAVAQPQTSEVPSLVKPPAVKDDEAVPMTPNVQQSHQVSLAALGGKRSRSGEARPAEREENAQSIVEPIPFTAPTAAKSIGLPPRPLNRSISQMVTSSLPGATLELPDGWQDDIAGEYLAEFIHIFIHYLRIQNQKSRKWKVALC